MMPLLIIVFKIDTGEILGTTRNVNSSLSKSMLSIKSSIL
jgi:hypothetical protein